MPHMWLNPNYHMCSLGRKYKKKGRIPIRNRPRCHLGNNYTCNRNMYDKLKQENNESVKKWYSRLLEIVQACKFGDEMNKKLKSKFVEGIKVSEVRDAAKKLAENEPMENVLKVAKQAEAAYEREIFGSEAEIDSSEEEKSDRRDDEHASGNEEDEEWDPTEYDIHAFNCQCLQCNIIRQNMGGRRRRPIGCSSSKKRRR